MTTTQTAQQPISKTPAQHGYEDGAQMMAESLDAAHYDVAERGWYRLDTTGWDDALVNAMGVEYVCELFGEDPGANRTGWTSEMGRKLREYNDGAVAGAHAALIEAGIAEDAIRDA